MIIDRYIISEITKPMLLGCGMLVLIFTGYSSAVHLTNAAQGLIQLSTVSSLILLNTVIALEVLLPTALYLSIIYALGRLHRDSEMAALNASGIGEIRVAASVFALSLLVAIVVAMVSIIGRPWAYKQSYRLESEAKAEFNINKIETGRFLELKNSHYVLFAHGIDSQRDRLLDVFLQRDAGGKNSVIYAREAYLPPAEPGTPRIVEFINGFAYTLDQDGSKDVTLKYKTLSISLGDNEREVNYKRKAQPTAILRESTRPKDIAEYQWRLSTPLSTILLALLAVPLSRTKPRQGRYTSFFVAIVVYIVLLNLVSIARNWVEHERVGAFPGIWWVYALTPVFLLLLYYKDTFRFRSRQAHSKASSI